MRKIKPGNQPFTVSEAREGVAVLRKSFSDDAAVTGALGLVLEMLDHINCPCSSPRLDAGAAEIIQLRPGQGET